MITVPRKGPLPAPHIFRCSFGRTAKSRVWSIRQWGGEAYSNPYYHVIAEATRPVVKKK